MLRPGLGIALVVSLLASVPALPTQASQYVVRPGDTLGSIAATHGTSIAVLARANGIANVNFVRAGSTLVIPDGRRYVSAQGGSQGGGGWYHVVWGDTLYGIAARYGTSVAELRALNPVRSAYLLAGRWLRVCNQCGAGQSGQTQAPVPASSSGGGYVVQPGDSVSAIAARFGVSEAALAAANGLANPNFIAIGARLTIPGSASVSVAPTVSSAQGGSSGQSLISGYASQYGVEPSFALAIGQEESGFNPSVVSKTGAVGLMQIEPYTGAHIAGILGRQVNLYDPSQNAQAGNLWLSRLLQYYGGNQYMAAAAYYQGIGSIARHGLYLDTRQYANNVMALKSSFGG